MIVIDLNLVLSLAQTLLFVFLYYVYSFVLYKMVRKSTPGFVTWGYLERNGDYGQSFVIGQLLSNDR